MKARDSLVTITLLLGLMIPLSAQCESAPEILPTGCDFPTSVQEWAKTWEEMDYEALFQAAKAQVMYPRPEDQNAIDIPSDGITGPFLFVNANGKMMEKSFPLQDHLYDFFVDIERWETIAAEGAPPVFMVAERQGNRVLGTYEKGATVSASVYRLYIIDGHGTLLGWDEVSSSGPTPDVLVGSSASSASRTYDDNPYPLFLRDMRYRKETMVIQDGVLILYQTEAPAELVIPDGVSTIAEGAFRFTKGLQRVVLPSSLRYIGPRVFSFCKELAEVVFAEGLIEIGPSAFSFCKKLTEVEFPSTLRRIGWYAFNECSELERAAFNDGLQAIEAFAFEKCVKLDNIIFPDSLAYIGFAAFGNCSDLLHIDFGQGKYQIDTSAFAGTSWLTDQLADQLWGFDKYVVIGDTLVAYDGRGGKFTVPKGVRHVSAKVTDEELTELALPEGVETVGMRAFAECYNLAEIEFPSTLKYVGSNAFENTAWLSSQAWPVVVGDGVYIMKMETDGDEPSITIPNGMKCVNLYIRSSGLIPQVVIPELCESICIEISLTPRNYAHGVAELFIPESVSRIDYSSDYHQTRTIVHCVSGSMAERWAIMNGFDTMPLR